MFATAQWCRHHLLIEPWLNRTGRISQKVLIPCNLPTTVTVHWIYCPGEHDEIEHLTANGLIVDNRKDRFQLEPNGLLITDVQFQPNVKKIQKIHFIFRSQKLL